jgi:hypothetical protein
LKNLSSNPCSISNGLYHIEDYLLSKKFDHNNFKIIELLMAILCKVNMPNINRWNKASALLRFALASGRLIRSFLWTFILFLLSVCLFVSYYSFNFSSLWCTLGPTSRPRAEILSCPLLIHPSIQNVLLKTNFDVISKNYIIDIYEDFNKWYNS